MRRTNWRLIVDDEEASRWIHRVKAAVLMENKTNQNYFYKTSERLKLMKDSDRWATPVEAFIGSDVW